MKHRMLMLFGAALALAAATARAEEWKPVEGRLMTRWAAEVDPSNPLPEHPRPQLVRPEWQSLNGLWDYAVTSQRANASTFNDGKILVPFAIESALSGVGRTFSPDEKLWYRRTFEIPESWRGKRILLHFGAVDYTCAVTLNGREIGTHEGGNDAFTFDITEALFPSGLQVLSLWVTDPTDTGRQPRGKQVLEPKGIYYTAVSGIWKTVWLEAVGEQYVRRHRGTPDIDLGTYSVSADIAGADDATRVRFTALDGGRVVDRITVAPTQTATLRIPHAKLWSPEQPHLYDLRIEVLHGNRTVDRAESYFGMRKISIGKDERGIDRMLLNGEFVFQYGFLDQGWWPDGLLTAPTDEALRWDIEFTKRAGYNTIRKHIKLESERFYYYCDKLGMLVWQDAVSGDSYNLKNFPRGIEKDRTSAAQFERELKAMMDQLHNYPCIVNWVVFNEGWGQYDNRRVIDWAKDYDPSRLVEVSGWVDMGTGDVADIHHYPAPGRVEYAGERRAFAVGEFGGLGLPVEGHLWNPDMRNWGYATYTDRQAFIDTYKSYMFQLRTMIDEGLSAAIYTQTTDVEGEVNGMVTYDRAVEKIPADELARINSILYDTELTYRVLLPDSQREPQRWYYSTWEPAANWSHTRKHPVGWSEGLAPFGYNHPDNQLSYTYYERTAPAHAKNTPWQGENLWIWRTFTLDELPEHPCLRVRYDEEVEVYVNGVKVLDTTNRPVHYYHTDLVPLPAEAVESLRKGENVIAAHAVRTPRPKQPQSSILDVGLLDLVVR